MKSAAHEEMRASCSIVGFAREVHAHRILSLVLLVSYHEYLLLFTTLEKV